MPNIFRRTAVAPALAGAAVACGPAAPQFTAQDETTITAKFNATPGYFLSGNADAWVKEFTEDAILQPPNAPVATGRDGLRSWFKAFPPLESISFSNVKVRGAGNMAWGTSNYTLKLKDGPTDTGKQIAVVQRNAAGTWETVAVSFNSDLPAAPPAPAPAKGAGKAPAK